MRADRSGWMNVFPAENASAGAAGNKTSRLRRRAQRVQASHLVLEVRQNASIKACPPSFKIRWKTWTTGLHHKPGASLRLVPALVAVPVPDARRLPRGTSARHDTACHRPGKDDTWRLVCAALTSPCLRRLDLQAHVPCTPQPRYRTDVPGRLIRPSRAKSGGIVSVLLSGDGLHRLLRHHVEDNRLITY